MSAAIRAWATPYTVVVGAVAVMGVLRVLLNPLLGHEYPLITFFPALFVAAWWGGWWPSVVATVFGAMLSMGLVIAPLRSGLALRPVDLTGLLLFVADRLRNRRSG
jgi:hypothetical protein